VAAIYLDINLEYNILISIGCLLLEIDFAINQGGK